MAPSLGRTPPVLRIGLRGTIRRGSIQRPKTLDKAFYRELQPIPDQFQDEALRVNGLDCAWVCKTGKPPAAAMNDASEWVRSVTENGNPVLAAYPLSFDWSWLYWYFVRFAQGGSPFNHSRCFDIKTAFAVKARVPVTESGILLWQNITSTRPHTHNALDDAREQAEMFARLFEWEGVRA